MIEHSENIPNPKEIEKEISDFLSKKFGGVVKMINPSVQPQHMEMDTEEPHPADSNVIDFELKPKDLIAYLDQYIVKQDSAKKVLATKVCTHFNRIKWAQEHPDVADDMIGNIKNNILMIGPTGVGKTYIIKLIAQKLGVPFVKGDATKFSETGYVGGDVEDLVRDLVREAGDDIERAQYGIVYIDEIDKIASSHNLVGADVSRTGVQRALLKPMEETEVDLKVPHDPISMLQEMERFRKSGSRDKRTINTKNILFIMSGAFADLAPIIKKRLTRQVIGFGADIRVAPDQFGILNQVKSEDLIAFGFESEFVGRLPVRAVLEHLSESDLYQILKNPNNPIILGKKLDFAAYGIQVKFEQAVLRQLAKTAHDENTGARGLVSAVERLLLEFETQLPSTSVKFFPVTDTIVNAPQQSINQLIQSSEEGIPDKEFDRLLIEEKRFIKEYLRTNGAALSDKHSLTLTPSRIDIVATYYVRHNMDIGKVVKQIKSYYDEVKKIELYFFKSHDINIVLEEDAVDFIMEQIVIASMKLENFYQQLARDFEHGLKLIREKTGRNRFFISRNALVNPEAFISTLIRNEMKNQDPPPVEY